MSSALRPRTVRVPGSRTVWSLVALAVVAASVASAQVFHTTRHRSTASGATADRRADTTAGGAPVAVAVAPSQPAQSAAPSTAASATPPAPAKQPAPPGFTLVWSPSAARDGLGAFEGVEDDRAHTDPGNKHIYVEGDHYRVDMTMKIHDTSPDRQRNEVKGMRAGGKVLEMNKGETWRLTYSMFIPGTLEATTSFTHIMQLKMPGNGSAPILTTSLRRKGNRPTIEVNLFGQTLVGDTDLAPLQNRWITSSLEFRIADKPDGYVTWTLTSGGRTVESATRAGADTFLADRVRPKWGIYRSLSDTTHLQNTYLLLTDMQAFKKN